MGNLGADAYFDMKLDGHKVWLIERDGNVMLEPLRVDHVFLSPGARATVVVQAGRRGRYAWRHRDVDTGPAGDPNPPERLGRFIVSGKPVGGGHLIRRRLRMGPARPFDSQPNPNTIAELKVDRTRFIDFSESADGNTFFINDKVYQEDRVDTTTRVGQVERWILRNFSEELHVFHLHQTAFFIDRVIGGSRDPAQRLALRDVINMPYARDGRPGVVEIIIPFTNPIIAGEFVYHCHLVQHEDQGMMANIVVLPRKRFAEQVWDKVTELAGLDVPSPWRTASASPSLDLEGNICRSTPGESQIAVN